MPANIGRIVKRVFFADYPAFSVTVCFSRGRAGLFAPGVYTDPRSIWFNVFFGYYEVVAPRPQWCRPFAYRWDGNGTAVEFADLRRIGKADWNYFSSYLYGVPEACIAPHNHVDDPGAETRYHGRLPIAAREWDLVELTGVGAVSSYVSGRDGQRLVANSRVFSPIWRMAFGRPHPRAEYPHSFFPTRMHAKVYLSYAEEFDRGFGCPAFKTRVFGGTVSEAYPDAAARERFLDIQLQALRRVIEARYPTLGFQPAPPRAYG